jgi:hypothetical protein
MRLEVEGEERIGEEGVDRDPEGWIPKRGIEDRNELSCVIFQE